MGSVREPVNIGAAEAGTGVGRPRQLAGVDGPEAAEAVMQEEGIVHRQTVAETIQGSDETQGDTTEGAQSEVKGPAEDRDTTEVHESLQGTEDQSEPQGEATEGFDVDSATVEELRAEAAARGVEGRSDMNKAELQDALRS